MNFPTQMYQNHSDIPLLELKHQYFNRLPVCWEAERLKSPLCFAQFCFFRAVLWKWKAYFSLLSPCPQHFFSTFTLHSLWYIRCSFSLSFVSLTYLSSLLCYICTSFPLPLWVSRIHLNPGRFPGGGNLQETPAADLFIVVHAFWLCTCVFVHCL